jgi:protein involved in sex pheromone biosynthesis
MWMKVGRAGSLVRSRLKDLDIYIPLAVYGVAEIVERAWHVSDTDQHPSSDIGNREVEERLGVP